MKLFLTILQYFPAVLAGAAAIEQTVGSAAPGTAKKTLFLNSIQGAAQAVGYVIPEPHVQAIASLTDTVVTGLNATLAVFGKIPPTPNNPGPLVPAVKVV